MCFNLNSSFLAIHFIMNDNLLFSYIYSEEVKKNCTLINNKILSATWQIYLKHLKFRKLYANEVTILKWPECFIVTH